MSPENQQVPTPASAAPTPRNTIANKTIGNAARSTMLLGVLMAILSLISMLGISSLEEDRQVINWLFLPLVLVVSITWIVAGLKLKKATTAQQALAPLNLIIVSALAVAGLTVLAMFVSPGGGGLAGLLALILAIYLLVVKSKLKKSNS